MPIIPQPSFAPRKTLGDLRRRFITGLSGRTTPGDVPSAFGLARGIAGGFADFALPDPESDLDVALSVLGPARKLSRAKKLLESELLRRARRNENLLVSKMLKGEPMYITRGGKYIAPVAKGGPFKTLMETRELH